MSTAVRIAVLLAGYAGFGYWAVRRLGTGGRLMEAAILIVMIAYAAYVSLAWLRGWPALTPTVALRRVFLPLDKWLDAAFRNLD